MKNRLESINLSAEDRVYSEERPGYKELRPSSGLMATCAKQCSTLINRVPQFLHGYGVEYRIFAHLS